MTDWGVRRVASPGAELRKWRKRRKLSLRALGSLVRLDYSHLAKIERGQARFTLVVAQTCDRALDAGGALLHAYYAAQGSIRPAQLPAVRAHLVGRDAELAVGLTAVKQRVPGAPAVVGIDGPAGVGKTALALALAHHVADEHVDGQLYADLGGFAPEGKARTVEQVLEGFLTAMGAISIPATLAERSALYRSLLVERRVLIVLDNVADLDEVAQLIPSSAGCTVMVTSRSALVGLATRLSSTRVTLQPLSELDSVRLVQQLMGDAGGVVDADTLTSLTRLCGHLPVVLGGATEQIAMYRHRRVVDLVDELIEEGNRLSGWETLDLREMFSWSYRRLGIDAARMFRLSGLHPGPHLSVPAAAALIGLTRPQTRRLLHSLTSLHLIEVDSQNHYPVIRVHDLVRAYARDLVFSDSDEGAEERTAAIQRLVTWYAAAVRAAILQLRPQVLTPLSPDSALDGPEPLVFTDEVDATAWCTSERDNIGPIAALALQHGPASAAHRFLTGVTDLGLLDLGLLNQHTDQPSPTIGS